MNQFWLGMVAAWVAAALTWVVYTEWRLRQLSAKLLVSEQAVKDKDIEKMVKDLSPDALDVAISKALGGADQATDGNHRK